MSLRAMLWAMTEAPVESTGEWAVLVVMADCAKEDGRQTYLSVPTIARRARLGESTVRKYRAAMVERGLIRLSDDIPPSVLAIPPERRPACYDLDLSVRDPSLTETPLPARPKPINILSTREGEDTQLAAAATDYLRDAGANLDEPQQQAEDVTTVAVTQRNQIPWTEVHLLRNWFGVERQEQVDAWRAAWRTAVDLDDGKYDPSIHLTAYLVRCREEKRDPKPSRWLKFFIEDRESYAAAVQAHQDRLEQQARADGGEQWALNSLSRTPKWEGKQ